MTDINDNLNCPEITDDMLLDLTEKVRTHIDKCESCRRRAQEVGLIAGALREDPGLNEDIPIPESVDRTVRTMAGEAAARQRRTYAWARTLRWLVPAAAVVLVMVIASFLTLGGHVSEKSMPAMEPSARQAKSGTTRERLPYIQEAEQRKEDSSVMLLEAKKDIEDLRDNLTELKESLSTEKKKAAQVEKELAAEKEASVVLAETIRKREESSKRLENTMAELIKELERKQTASEQNAEILRKENELLLAEVGKLMERMKKLETDLSSANSALAVLRTEKADLERKLVLKGDYNRDGRADVADAMSIVDALLSTGDAKYNAEGDANNDGKIDVGDALVILNRALVE